MGIIKSVKGGIQTENHILKAVNYITNVKSNNFPIASDNEIHLKNSIDYVVREGKSKCVSYVNCNSFDVQNDFRLTRMAYGKNSGILCHHYVQSFSPDENITPEQAHQMALDLLEENAKNFQAVVSTHIDKSHIHTHILLNSVNMETGEKWRDNQTTLKALREAHDKLCLKNGFSVTVAENSNGVNHSSYIAVEKGVSWKEQIANELRMIMKSARSKGEFISKLESRGFEVKWTDCNITLQKDSHKVRVDTLAKQFGKEFTKVNIEATLNEKFDTKQKRKEWHNKLLAERERNKQETQAVPTERYKNYSYGQREISYIATPEYIPYSSQHKKSVLSVLGGSMVSSPRRIGLRVLMYFLLKQQKQARERSREIRYLENHRIYRQPRKCISESELPTRRLGNINYFELTQSYGENFAINIPAEKLAKLINISIFFSASLRADGSAWLTCKKKDSKQMLKLLGISEESIKPDKYGYETYKAMKKRNADIAYAKLSEKQFEKLKEHDFEMSVFKKEGEKTVISFDRQNYDLLRKLTASKFIGMNYSELKKLAETEDDKLCFLLVDRSDFDNLLKNRGNIKFSAFYKEEKDKYNVAYLGRDKEKIQEVLYSSDRQNKNRFTL